MSKEVTITVTATMNPRWVPYFVAMLKQMEYCGNIGRSRTVGIYADGDGDFQPKFDIDPPLENLPDPRKANGGSVIFDAG